MGIDYTKNTWAAGTVLTAARLNALEGQYADFLAHHGAVGIYRCHRNANLNGIVSSGQDIAFDTEGIDTASVYTVGANIVVPAAGFYSVFARVTLQDTSSTIKFQIELHQYNTTFERYLDYRGCETISGMNTSLMVNATCYLGAGRSIRVKALHTDGVVGQNVLGGAALTWLTIIRWH